MFANAFECNDCNKAAPWDMTTWRALRQGSWRIMTVSFAITFGMYMRIGRAWLWPF
jgi:hypothetical protein